MIYSAFGKILTLTLEAHVRNIAYQAYANCGIYNSEIPSQNRTKTIQLTVFLSSLTPLIRYSN